MNVPTTQSGRPCKKCKKGGSPCHLHSPSRKSPSPSRISYEDDDFEYIETTSPDIERKQTLIELFRSKPDIFKKKFQLLKMTKTEILHSLINYSAVISTKNIHEIFKNTKFTQKEITHMLNMSRSPGLSVFLINMGAKPSIDKQHDILLEQSEDILESLTEQNFKFTANLTEDDWTEIFQGEITPLSMSLMIKLKVDISSISLEELEDKIEELSDKLDSYKLLQKYIKKK